jgi:hypothetical protein
MDTCLHKAYIISWCGAKHTEEIAYFIKGTRRKRKALSLCRITKPHRHSRDKVSKQFLPDGYSNINIIKQVSLHGMGCSKCTLHIHNCICLKWINWFQVKHKYHNQSGGVTIISSGCNTVVEDKCNFNKSYTLLIMVLYFMAPCTALLTPGVCMTTLLYYS